LGEAKYRELGKHYSGENLQLLNKTQINHVKQIFVAQGLKVEVGS
jgi:hypothetical protein